MPACSRGLIQLGKETNVNKRTLWAILKYLLGLVLLTYVIWRNFKPAGDSPGIADALQRPVHWAPLTLACLICLGSVLLTFVRWYVLVRAQELPFTLPNAMRLGMIGYFLSNFLPAGSVGGDIIKAAFVAREQSRRTVAVATVLIDRAIGLWGLCWLVALLGLAFWSGGLVTGEAAGVLQTIIAASVGIVAVSLVVWLLLGFLPQYRADRFAGRLEKIPKLGHSAAEFWRAVWMYRCRSGSVALALALSLVGHVGFVSTFYFSALALQPADEIPSAEVHFLIVPIGMAIQAGFPAPGGVGGGEYAFGYLYSLVGYPMANGVLASLVQRMITWGLGLVGYLVYLRMRPALQNVRVEPVSEFAAA
jgi:uncharacterized protein (TIRG00374 family)